MRVILRESGSVVLNGSGAGTVKIGPLTAREKWYPESVWVSVNASPTLEAQCVISVGDVNTKRQRDVTVNGSTGDSTGKLSGDTVRVGEFVWADWTGGDANQRATLIVMGEKEV